MSSNTYDNNNIWLHGLTHLPYNVYCVGGDVKHSTIKCNLWSLLQNHFLSWQASWSHYCCSYL